MAKMAHNLEQYLGQLFNFFLSLSVQFSTCLMLI